MKVTEAIILAGGLGTRLRSAVPDLPKCMAPVAYRPFLSYVIDYYRTQGIQRFVFSLGYMNEVILAYLDKEYADLDYTYVIEEEPLGTGGAIRLACTVAITEAPLILNGDTLFHIELASVSKFHFHKNAGCTLSLKPMTQFSRYGVVELNADGTIQDFKEKKYYEHGLINGGVYVLDKASFCSRNWPEKFSFEKDYLEKEYGNKTLYGIVQEGYFIDIGIPEDFTKAQTELPAL